MAVNRKGFQGPPFTDKLIKRLLLLAILLFLLQAAAKSCSAAPDTAKEKDTACGAMLRSLAEAMENRLSSQFLPVAAFAMDNSNGSSLFWKEQIIALFPYYKYAGGEKLTKEERGDIRTILLAESEEGDYQAEQSGDETEVPPQERMPGEGAQAQGEGNSSMGEPEPQEDPSMETMQELLREENEAAKQPEAEISPGFLPHTKQAQVDLEALGSYETLIQQFYTIDANTTAGSDQLDVERLLAQDMTIEKDSSLPQILLYHTHSQEAFADSVPGDATTSIMGVGEHLAQILRETYGYNVLHHLGQYDIESRDDSYSVALSDIQQILNDYPSIQVVIDLHRDALPEATHLAMDLDGRPTAKFMFFNGLSRTKKTGNIAYLYNENLDGNLAFSFQMQLKAMEYYPNLTRKIYLKGYRYNMHLKPRCLLVELGAQNNTVEEAMNACDPLAHILDLVLSGEGG